MALSTRFPFSLASRTHEVLQDEDSSLALAILLYLNGFEGSCVSYSYIFVLNLSENKQARKRSTYLKIDFKYLILTFKSE